jgi:hypothetical protein
MQFRAQPDAATQLQIFGLDRCAQLGEEKLEAALGGGLQKKLILAHL